MAKSKEKKPLTAVDVVTRSLGVGKPAAAMMLTNVDSDGCGRIVAAYQSKKDVRGTIERERTSATKPAIKPVEKPTEKSDK